MLFYAGSANAYNMWVISASRGPVTFEIRASFDRFQLTSGPRAQIPETNGLHHTDLEKSTNLFQRQPPVNRSRNAAMIDSSFEEGRSEFPTCTE